ncbi:SAV_2336 N-terminal domain-related protein [Micromonospora echinospora]|uniref:SAV_2336 N-terminal domain-related protein n=1 Tax=Micromonospora echinospora TaxID=1877 RepID=UPI003A85F48A
MELTPQELVDTLWLATQISARPSEPGTPARPDAETTEHPEPKPPPTRASSGSPTAVKAYPYRAATGQTRSARVEEIPKPIALGDRLAFQRALRPLLRRVPAHGLGTLDEDATARRAAEHPVGTCWPAVMRPPHELWLDALVLVDDGDSMAIWQDLAGDIVAVLRESGVFRQVSQYGLNDPTDGAVSITDRRGQTVPPRRLVDPGNRRLVFVISDCVGAMWRSGKVGTLLHELAKRGPVAILQPLPERLWARTGTRTVAGTLSAPRPCAPNTDLSFLPFGGRAKPEGTLIPVLQADSMWLRRWTTLIAGAPPITAAVTGTGVVVPDGPPSPPETQPSAEQRIRDFRAVASREAFQLARYVALGEPQLDVIRYVQHATFRPAQPAHLAEFLLSGLLRVEDSRRGLYQFVEGVPELLLKTLSVSQTLEASNLHKRVSAAVQRRRAAEAAQFRVLIPGDGDDHLSVDSRPFATITPIGQHRVEQALSSLQNVTNHQPGLRPRATPMGTSRPASQPVDSQAPPSGQEAVELYRRLAGIDPAAHLPDLAASLSSLGAYLYGLGRRDEALTATGEATDIYRQLAGMDSAAYLPDLAASLSSLGAYLYGLGRWDEARVPAEEATAIYRRLAETNSATAYGAGKKRVTEIYVKAVEQLGSDWAPVRFSGLYALERLAQDNPADRQSIVEVICAYLRMPYTPPEGQPGPDTAIPSPADDFPAPSKRRPRSTIDPSSPTLDPREERQVRLSAQHILTRHLQPEIRDGVPNPNYWGPQITLNLDQANLTDLDLTDCHLHDATFTEAHFSGDSRFVGATFSGDARFDQVNFGGDAVFVEAMFAGTARFDGATFSGGAGFGGATFSGAAVFVEATFRGIAQFGMARFSGAALFRGAMFSGAGGFVAATFRSEADFDGATVGGENFEGPVASSGAELTLGEVAALAIRAHDGQQEMYGGPYHGHLRAVAEALAPFGPDMEMAGWLHDILEMTEWTADQLREAGVPNRVVDIVERVTPVRGIAYLDSIRRISQDPEATLVKIADNADSIYPERIPVIPNSGKLLADFEQARPILWSATSPENVEKIVGRVNRPLLERYGLPPEMWTP